jgi:hypothetical protein
MITISETHYQYPSTERIFSEFIRQIFTGWPFLHKFLSSLERTKRILISWKARGAKWWIENEAKTKRQLLTCSAAALNYQGSPSWDVEMKTCSSQLYFHGLASGKSIHTISDRLWYVDPPQLFLLLNKNDVCILWSNKQFLMSFNISKTIFELCSMNLRIVSYHST